jgi:tetratricopeptide (TPR) repeat protein
MRSTSPVRSGTARTVTLIRPLLSTHQPLRLIRHSSRRSSTAGGMYDRRGDYDRAIADFTKAAQVGPKPMTPLAFINRGLAHQKKGDFDRAIADYSHAIELSKARAAYFNRGNAFAGKGDYEHAIADYTRVIELQPSTAVAYQARGAAYEALSDAVQAQADRSRAIEIAGPQTVVA